MKKEIKKQKKDDCPLCNISEETLAKLRGAMKTASSSSPSLSLRESSVREADKNKKLKKKKKL
ncbi:MAG: hypothetical protein Q7S82_02375 [bacterium]|nr:hypothetical protein [bacterium]